MLDDGPDRTVRLDRDATDGRRFAKRPILRDSAVATMTQCWQYFADSANSNPRLLRRARIGADWVGWLGRRHRVIPNRASASAGQLTVSRRMPGGPGRSAVGIFAGTTHVDDLSRSCG
jgi:hypothetical protein